jgi:putative ABC transport system permease protein
MPKGFEYPVREQIWVPAAMDETAVQRGEGVGYAVVGRLSQGVSLEQAQTELHAVASRIAERYPATNAGLTIRLRPLAHEYVHQDARRTIMTMFLAALLVLAVACANVANLALARNAARSRELALRTALGASRWRLVAHLLTESLVVSLLGGAVGFWIAHWAGELAMAVIRTGGDFAPPYWVTFRLDWRSFAFATGVAFLAAAMAGLAPALRASRANVSDALSWGGRGASLSPMGRLTRGFVALQIAFSCVVLILAGLMARSVIALQAVDIGAETENVLTGRIGLFETDYPEHVDQIQFFERLRERLTSLPGVEWATVSNSLPGALANNNWFAPRGYDLGDGSNHPFAREVIAAPNYFDAFAIRLLEGRGFHASDEADARPVVVVNRMLGERYWPGRSPLGQQLRLGRGEEAEPWRTVVGVVADVIQDEVDDGVQPTIYLPLAQRSARFMSIALGARGGDAMLLAEPMRKAVLELDRDLPVYWVRTLSQWIDLGRFATRFIASIFALAALAGLALGAAGQYAVLAYTVSRRTREIGVRRALGALDREVIRLLLREGAAQVSAGLLLGLILSVGLARLLANTLSGVGTFDPITYSSVAASLVAATGLASVIPARRALSVDPAVALRCE